MQGPRPHPERKTPGCHRVLVTPVALQLHLPPPPPPALGPHEAGLCGPRQCPPQPEPHHCHPSLCQGDPGAVKREVG